MNEHPSSQPAAVTISVNGEVRTVGAGTTIAALLREYNVLPAHVVTQLNGDILPRDGYDRVVLCDGDRLEIVTLVGGG